MFSFIKILAQEKLHSDGNKLGKLKKFKLRKFIKRKVIRVKVHPTDRQAAASSPSADVDKITRWSNTWNMSFKPEKSHSHNVSLKGPSGTPHPGRARHMHVG